MRLDLARPHGSDGIVPVIDAAAIILAIDIAHRQIELDQPRCAAGQNLRANLPPQFGEIGLLLALARDQDEIGGIDGAHRRKRQLLGITAADTDQRKS